MAERTVNVGVLVSGGGTNLQAIIDAQKSGIISSGRVCVVISSKKDAYALTRAAKEGIPAFSVSKKEQGGQEGFEAEIKRILKEHDVELIVLAGFLSILSEDLTSSYERRIINIHPSLIPSFCGEGFYGLRVHEAALERGVKLTGATVHFVNEIPDGGEIITQKAVEVKDGDTPEILQRRVMEEAEWDIFPKAVEIVCKEIIREGKGA